MQPWTVDAWIAFLNVILPTLQAMFWPAIVLTIALMFRESINQILARDFRVKRGDVTVETLNQNEPREPDPLTQLQNANFGQLEQELSPWLNRIRAEMEEENLALNQATIDRLVLGLALSQRRADFLDIWRRILGSQAELLIKLSRSIRLSAASISEVHSLHRGRMETGAMSTDDWLAFLLNYNLVLGDKNQLELTVYGQQFVQFLDDEGLNVSSKPW